MGAVGNRFSPENLVRFSSLLVLTLLQLCLASRGDESPLFRSCVQQCLGVQESKDENVTTVRGLVPTCVGTDNSRVARLPFSWDCKSDCKYRCMWNIESNRSKPPEKYFGKWPFVRLGLMQEPASVVLSLANLAANAHCLIRLVGLPSISGALHGLKMLDPRRYTHILFKQSAKQGSRSKKKLTMVHLWAVHFALAVNAWTWSSVFHSRDLLVTERLDYFSAGAVMVFDVYLSCLRVFGLSSRLTTRGLLAFLAFGYFRHMFYMHFVKFDYGYHVGLCVAAGILQSLLWVSWTIFSTEGRSHPRRWSLWAFVIGVNAAVLLEILDFPPIWHVIDAHALWHLCTVPLTYVLWDFVSIDIGVA